MKNKLLIIIVAFVFGNLRIVRSQVLSWAKQMGGTGNEYGYSIALDASGNVYTTGSFNSTVDFDPGAGIFNLTPAGEDIFISKLDAAGNFVWAKAMNGSGIGHS